MLALGIVTLFLTCFVMIYYAYLSHHTDSDVSFFMSVGIISLVMNLLTNGSAGAVQLAWLYLILAVLFLGVGFAVNLHGTIAFYGSIGPWFAGFFRSPTLLLEIVSFLLPPVGIVLYFVYSKSDLEKACVCGKRSMWGLLFWFLVIMMILGIVAYGN